MKTVTSADGTKIAYDQTGAGPVVVLVSGAFNTRSFGPNESLAPVLAKDFTVINYDRRGRGESSNVLPYSVAREVEDLAALIKSSGGKVSLYGISSGAALALEAANMLSGIEKVALFEAPFVVDGSRTPIPTNFAEHLNALVKSGRSSEAIKYFMTKGVGLPGIFVMMMRLMPAWKQLKAAAPTAPYDAQTLHSNGSGRPLDGAQWQHVTMPTLVMSGGKSPKWMQHAMPALAQALPNAMHRTLPGQIHIVKAEAIAPIITQFFKGELADDQKK